MAAPRRCALEGTLANASFQDFYESLQDQQELESITMDDATEA